MLTAKTNRVGMRRFAVPAGIFAAQVVRLDVAKTLGSRRAEVFLTYYLVAGVGTLKAVATIKAAGVGTAETAVTVQELQSVTKRR